AYSARLEDDMNLTNAFRFAIVPLYLFSGTFFPISQLPDCLEPLAYVTLLFHAVELTRNDSLIGVGFPVVTTVPTCVSVAYLVAMITVAWVLAIRSMRERLQK